MSPCSAAHPSGTPWRVGDVDIDDDEAVRNQRADARVGPHAPQPADLIAVRSHVAEAVLRAGVLTRRGAAWTMAIARSVDRRVQGNDLPADGGDGQSLVNTVVHAPIGPIVCPPSPFGGTRLGSAGVLTGRRPSQRLGAASGDPAGDRARRPSMMRKAACSRGERHPTSARSLRAAAACSERWIVSEGTIRLNAGRGREINEPKARRTLRLPAN